MDWHPLYLFCRCGRFSESVCVAVFLSWPKRLNESVHTHFWDTRGFVILASLIRVNLRAAVSANVIKLWNDDIDKCSQKTVADASSWQSLALVNWVQQMIPTELSLKTKIIEYFLRHFWRIESFPSSFILTYSTNDVLMPLNEQLDTITFTLCQGPLISWWS